MAAGSRKQARRSADAPGKNGGRRGGIRPEHVLFGTAATTGAIISKVEMIKPIGADTPCLGPSDQSRLVVSDSMPVTFPADVISLFDDTNGMRI